MKKNFVEPELVRIDLKMTENIATSQGERYFRISNGNFRFYATRQYIDQCTTFVAKTDILFNWAISSEMTMEQEEWIMDTCYYRDLPLG